MKSSSKRKLVGGGFGALAVVVAVSSVAYACTAYMGQMTVTGNGSGLTEQTVVGDQLGMNWCPDPGDASTTSWPVKVLRNATITATTGSGTCTSNGLTGQLRDGFYRVGLKFGFMPQGGGDSTVHNCHASTTQPVATGNVTGGTGVFAPGVIAYTATKSGWHSICIFNGDGFVDGIAINISRV